MLMCHSSPAVPAGRPITERRLDQLTGCGTWIPATVRHPSASQRPSQWATLLFMPWLGKALKRMALPAQRKHCSENGDLCDCCFRLGRDQLNLDCPNPAWTVGSAGQSLHQQTAHCENLAKLAKPCETKNLFAKPCETCICESLRKLVFAKPCESWETNVKLRNTTCETWRNTAKH